MTHVDEEQLVLYYYGEAVDSAAVAAHLDACPACRADLAAIQATLNLAGTLAAPERGPAYGEQVWQRLKPHVRRRGFRWWPQVLAPRGWAAVAAMALLMTAAYWAGRWPVEPQQSTLSDGQRSRARLVYLGDHLERSQMLLTELSNAEPADLNQEQARAEDLLAANRLLRLSGSRNGDSSVGRTLDELEQLLTEVSNAGPNELDAIRGRLRDEDILFKLRVLNAHIKSRQRVPLERSSN